MTTFGSSNASVSAGVSADREGVWNPGLGNRFQLAVEAAGQTGFDDHRAERDHRIISGDRAVGFGIHHDEGHILPPELGCAIMAAEFPRHGRIRGDAPARSQGERRLATRKSFQGSSRGLKGDRVVTDIHTAK
jgi:hypothetical protein